MQATRVYVNEQNEQERKAQDYANQLMAERNAELDAQNQKHRMEIIKRGIA